MSNNKKKKKKNNHTSATSNVQAKKQTAVQTAKPAKAQNIETKQETVNTQAAVEKKEPVKVQTKTNRSRRTSSKIHARFHQRKILRLRTNWNLQPCPVRSVGQQKEND